jgi:hypothetical protein
MISIPRTAVSRSAICIAAVGLVLSGCSRRAPIDASPSTSSTATGTATLSWKPPGQNTDGSQAGNLAGYLIHYGTSPNDLHITIKIPDPHVTKYVVDNLSPGSYYFQIEAFTVTGARGNPSAIMSKVVH